MSEAEDTQQDPIAALQGAADSTVPDRTTAASLAVEAAATPAVLPLEGEASTMGRHAALLSAGTLASRLLGMARETLIAAMFPREATDAFFIAWRVPNALRAMLAEGAARYVLNPVLGDALHRGQDGKNDPDRMRAALATTRGAALVVLGGVTVLGVLFARPLFWLMSGGFGGDATRFELGVGLLRVLFPFIFFMGWFAVGNSALQLLKIVAPGAFAPVMLNVAFLTVPFGLAPLLARFGIDPIYSLAGAVLAGGALQTAWIRPALVRNHMAPRPRLEWNDTSRALALTFLPQIYGQAVYQLNTILAGRLLGAQPRGAASFFNYAQRIADIPQGLFSVALSGAAAIALQPYASRSEHDKAARVYETSLRMAAFVALPSAVVLAAYAEALVPLIFGYGRFRELGRTGIDEVVRSLRWQAIGVALMAFVNQTAAVFGAYQRRRDIVGAATVSLAVFWITGVLGTPRLGHVGVAAGLATSAAVQLVLLVSMVRRLVPVRFAAAGPTLAKVLFATGCTALCARAAVTWLPVTGFTLGAKVFALGCGSVLVAIYALVAWVLRCEEMTALEKKIRRRLRR